MIISEVLSNLLGRIDEIFHQETIDAHVPALAPLRAGLRDNVNVEVRVGIGFPRYVAAGDDRANDVASSFPWDNELIDRVFPPFHGADDAGREAICRTAACGFADPFVCETASAS
jgi:hypothetical protein